MVAETTRSIGPRPIVATGVKAAIGSYGSCCCVAAAVRTHRRCDDVRESWTALQNSFWWNLTRSATNDYIMANFDLLAKTVAD